MRKKNSAILEAVHDTAKGLHKAGVIGQLRCANSTVCARENIAPDELAAFKMLAKDYGEAGEARIATLLTEEELLEICHDN